MKTIYKFTLLELLMVVAIIVMLASILLPALSRARETSRATACQGTLKQFSCGAFLYSSDYNDYTLSFSDVIPELIWYNSLAPYMGIASGSPSEIWYKFSTSNTIYTCSSHRHREGTVQHVRGYYGLCYGINYRFFSFCVIDHFGDGRILPKTSMVKNPSELIYFMETDKNSVYSSYSFKIYGDPSSGWKLNDGGYYIEKYWHNGYPNHLYFDGHVGKAKWYSIPGSSEGGLRTWLLSGLSVR